MSRSMHSSTEYFGSPSEYFTNSSEKFSWTSVIGKRSLNTRSSPMSSRSCEAASSCSSASNARVWISSRCGICIPPASLANEICFIVSAIVTLTESGRTPRAPRHFRTHPLDASRSYAGRRSASPRHLHGETRRRPYRHPARLWLSPVSCLRFSSLRRGRRRWRNAPAGGVASDAAHAPQPPSQENGPLAVTSPRPWPLGPRAWS